MTRRTLSVIVACIALALVPGLAAATAHADEHGSRDRPSSESSGQADRGDAGHGGDDIDEIDGADEIDEIDEIDGEHDTARRAVEADEAIALGRMLTIFGATGGGVVVDIMLVRQGQSLQYRIKYIDPQGRVRQARFDARTGAAVP